MIGKFLFKISLLLLLTFILLYHTSAETLTTNGNNRKIHTDKSYPNLHNNHSVSITPQITKTVPVYPLINFRLQYKYKFLKIITKFKILARKIIVFHLNKAIEKINELELANNLWKIYNTTKKTNVKKLIYKCEQIIKAIFKQTIKNINEDLKIISGDFAKELIKNINIPSPNLIDNLIPIIHELAEINDFYNKICLATILGNLLLNPPFIIDISADLYIFDKIDVTQQTDITKCYFDFRYQFNKSIESIYTSILSKYMTCINQMCKKLLNNM